MYQMPVKYVKIMEFCYFPKFLKLLINAIRLIPWFGEHLMLIL